MSGLRAGASPRPLGPGEELMDGETFARLYTGARAGEDAARSESAGRPATVESLGRRAVDEAHRHAAAAAFFLVRGGGLQALCGDGLERPRPGLLFSTEGWSPVAAAIESGKPLRGAPARDALTQRVLRLLGRGGVREIALVPALVRGCAVALLLAHNGGERLGDASFAALREIGARLGRDFERAAAPSPARGVPEGATRATPR